MDRQRVLVFVAHPDDVDWAFSGTAALWSREKDVYYAIMTSGEKGRSSADLSARAFMEIREREQREAARIVGVKEVIFLRQTDGELENTPTLREEIVRVIRKVKPQIVATGEPAHVRYDNFYRYHPDHRAAAVAVYDSLYPAAGNPNFFPHLLEEGYPPHHVEEVYFFASDEATEWVDITPVMDLKVDALACHKSQQYEREMIEKIVKEASALTGKKAGMEYAESFRRLEVPP